MIQSFIQLLPFVPLGEQTRMQVDDLHKHFGQKDRNCNVKRKTIKSKLNFTKTIYILQDTDSR